MAYTYVNEFFDFFLIQINIFFSHSQAFTNIEKFLKPKCRSIVHCATSSSFFGVFVELSKDERFAPYMTNVYDHLPDYHFAEDQMKAFSKNVEAANLELEHINLKECTHEYQDQKVCQGMYSND